MTEEIEAWIIVVERIGFSAAIVGMIAYAIRAVAKWAAPLVQQTVSGHNTFLEKTTASTERMEENISTLTKAIAVKLDKRGNDYAEHVFSSTRLEDAAAPAADALLHIAEGLGKAAEVRPLIEKAKDALRG